MPEACLVSPRDSPRWLTLQIGSLVPVGDLSTCSENETLNCRDQAGEIGARHGGEAALCLLAPHLWNCALEDGLVPPSWNCPGSENYFLTLEDDF
jgi:hypothetical protein